ncbi:MAG: hypothetical protein ABH851_07340 [Methanobacteriota archaeon]
MGVELTHIPKDKIPKLIGMSMDLGTQVIIVYGESPIEPVKPGTNSITVSLPDVDILKVINMLRKWAFWQERLLSWTLVLTLMRI